MGFEFVWHSGLLNSFVYIFITCQGALNIDFFTRTVLFFAANKIIYGHLLGTRLLNHVEILDFR